jgi:hypothetical protein
MLSGHDCQVTRRQHEYCFEGLEATSCVLLILDSIDGNLGAWEVWHTAGSLATHCGKFNYTLWEVWLHTAGSLTHIAGSLTHIAGSLVHYGKFAYEYGKSTWEV